MGVRPPPPPPPPPAAACARRLLLPFSSKLVRAPLLVLDSARESNTALKKSSISNSIDFNITVGRLFLLLLLLFLPQPEALLLPLLLLPVCPRRGRRGRRRPRGPRRLEHRAEVRLLRPLPPLTLPENNKF